MAMPRASASILGPSCQQTYLGTAGWAWQDLWETMPVSPSRWLHAQPRCSLDELATLERGPCEGAQEVWTPRPRVHR